MILTDKSIVLYGRGEKDTKLRIDCETLSILCDTLKLNMYKWMLLFKNEK